VDERGLRVFDFRGDVAGKTEVGILVDGAGDEGGDLRVCFGVVAKDVWVGGREGSGGLDGGKVYLANVITVSAVSAGQ